MKRYLFYVIGHFALLTSLIYREYTKDNNIYNLFYTIATNNGLHFLHSTFVIYIIFINSKLLLNLTIGKLRNEEVSSINDNCFLFLTDMLLIINLFSNDITIKNLITFSILLSLKIINWIAVERIKHLVTKRTYFLLITTTFVTLSLFCWALAWSLKKPGISFLYCYEFGVVLLSCIKNFLYCNVHAEDDTKTFCVFIIDIWYISTKALAVLTFSFYTTIYFRIPFNMIREAYTTARLLYKKIHLFRQYNRVSKELVKCETVAGNCPICFVDMNDGKKISCGHAFHVSCIKKWIETSEVCPICRTPLFQSDEVTFLHGNEVITGIPVTYED